MYIFNNNGKQYTHQNASQNKTDGKKEENIEDAEAEIIDDDKTKKE